MIYVGYQGIGKSTLCNKVDNCIDLESSNFFVNGKRHEDWYKIYTNIAKHLSDQGKNVFTSSHKILRDYMNEEDISFTVIYPALELKDQWINKLKERYKLSSTEKDFKAWLNARELFEENIKDMSNEKNKIEINDIDYSLQKIIQ